jgi:hypothetical protein
MTPEAGLTRRHLLRAGGAIGALANTPLARGLFDSGSPQIQVADVSVNVLDLMSPAERADVLSNRARLDVTAACQRALHAGLQVTFPAGTYLVDAAPERCLKPVGNQRIVFEPGAILQAQPNNLELYSILLLDAVANVTIEGGELRGERALHRGTKGEHGMGLAIYDCRKVTVRNMTARDCWGDGFYVSGRGMAGRSQDIAIENCIAENNRRQGMTIAAVDRCRVTGGSYRKTSGIAPAAGIDIEPNVAVVAGIQRPKAGATNVILDGVDCSDNAGAGITVSQVHTANVRILNAVAHRNGESGIVCGYVGHDVEIAGADCRDNAWEGIHIAGDKAYTTRQIHVSSPRCSGNGRNGILFGLNVDGFSVIGGTVSDNGHNGILCDGTGGSVCDNGEIRGVLVEANSQAQDAAYDNIRIGALCHDLTIADNTCRAGQSGRRPAYGIRVTANEPMAITGNDLQGGGARGAARGGGSRVRWSGNRGA